MTLPAPPRPDHGPIEGGGPFTDPAIAGPAVTGEPPRSSPRSSPRWVAPAAVGVAGACACAAVAFWNPGDGGAPVCWSQGIFGVDCPFCGGLRAANSLLRGDVAAALDHNVLLAVAMPLLAFAWVVWLVRSLQDRPVPAWLHRALHPPRPVLIGLGVLLLVFAVVRNIDGGPGWVTWLHSTTYRG